jgi:hypothetical protein
LNINNTIIKLGVVVHACNSIYGRHGKEDIGRRTGRPQAKKTMQDHFFKKSNLKQAKKGWGCDSSGRAHASTRP